MPASRARWVLPAVAAALAAGWVAPPDLRAACCYFSAKDADILQPAQKVFITWDAKAGRETFTVQPKFEGNALDFGMVIPTPSQPKLDEMPRDFFKELAILTILKKREQPHSKLLYDGLQKRRGAGRFRQLQQNAKGDGKELRKSTVVVLEAGVVGSLDYKIIK